MIIVGKETKQGEKEREKGEEKEKRQTSQSRPPWWSRSLPDHTPPSIFILALTNAH